MAYVASPADGIAWITGASSGLGRAVALKLAERGWTVVATARNAVTLDTLVAGASGGPGEIIAFPGDVSKGGTIGQLVPRIEKKVGPIALAFFAAGEHSSPSNDLDRQSFQRSIEVNYFGTINCLSPVVAAMRGRGRGQIAMLASLAGHGGLPAASAYGPAKAALINLAESLQGGLAEEGIRLQIVNPGPIGPTTGQGWLVAATSTSYETAAAHLVRDLKRPHGFQLALTIRARVLLAVMRFVPYPVYFWLAGKLGRSSETPQQRAPRRMPVVREVEPS